MVVAFTDVWVDVVVPAVMVVAAVTVAQVMAPAAVDVVVMLANHSGWDGQCCSQLLQQSKCC